MNKTQIATSALCLLLGASAQAKPNDDFDLNRIKNKLSLTGFVAPTAIHTSDNNFYGSTDNKVSGNYMETGLLARYDFTPYLSFVGQALYKNVGASENHPDIDFAFINYDALQTFDHSVSLRAGKIKMPYGLHNDTRDVPFTRDRIFLPQSIYFENFRDSVFSQTGIEARGESIYDFGVINWNAGFVESESPANEIESIYSEANTFANYDGDYSGFFRLMYTNPSNNLKTALSLARLRYDVDTKMPTLLKSGTSEYDRAMLSVEYAFTPKLTLTTEGEYNQWNFSDLNSPILKNDYGLGYYAQMRYKWNDQWDSFVGAGATYNDFDDKHGEQYAENTSLNIDAHERYTENVTFGVGYQPTQNFLVRGEYSYFEGTSILPGSYNTSGNTDKYWQMVSLQASYQFDIL